ncbi:MAG TPA: SGNH/GDSL hydrolase family protein [Segeticoccus sp.]|uniref:SGNH/GDSL hydrolase family protein n=1 Tax=Segeticoccus sp. TaxID=2706531 RepID=UPI002D801042|nr:SGNH/GDSL hydrolase family protein [Segeticoccus sp.]HET8602066.1 SGNH/GDSL hydrolase family protein [Segeticoccus sp.]
MGKVAAARKLASAAVYGGGGLSVLGASLYGVLRAEATLARRQIGNADGAPPNATGWYGRGRPGPALKVALLGDSSAAGYGVHTVQETPGAHLASGLAEGADRRVYLCSVAFVGAQTRDLDKQIDQALAMEPHVAVILVGANDVTHSRLPSESVRLLREGVSRLVAAGVEVVVGTCPDLGTVEPIPPPLKQVARTWSRRLAAAQTIAVVDAGGRTVSLGSVLGPEFAASPKLLFGPDRFHPSAAGYSSLAQVMLPSVLAAAGVFEDLAPEPARGEAVMPISEAAVEAARTPGTEIDATKVGGAERGARGRWVQLRRRHRQPQTHVEGPESDESSEPAPSDSPHPR